MPKEPEGNFQVDDLIEKHKVPTVANHPAGKPERPVAGMFKAQDGRNYWRYDMGGEMVVLPKPIDQMSEQDFYSLPISLYDTQPGRLPQNLTVIFKDPQWAGYWFNKMAREGIRVSEARSLGFVPATIDDVETLVNGLSDNNGAVEQGDLVLMKTHKARLFLRYKEALDKAKLHGGINAYKSRAENSVRQAGGDLSKGPYFHTPQAMEEFQGVGPVVNLPTVASKL